MDTQQDSIQTLTTKLIYILEMEISTVGSLRHELKKAQAALAEAQSPYKEEKDAIALALRRVMLATGRPNIKHRLFTFSAFEQEEWDKDHLRRLLADIPLLQACVSQVPRHRLLLKD